MNINDKYQLIKIIKSGSIGMILEVKEKNNDKIHYALKMMQKNLYEEYKKEIEVNESNKK